MKFILYFGHVNIDIILRVTKLPGIGESTEVIEVKERIGGTAYNAYKSLKALNVPTDIFTVVGEDFTETLEGHIIRGEKTPRCWIANDGIEQMAFVYQGIWKHSDKLRFDLLNLEKYHYIHFSTGNPHFYISIAREARKLGKEIAFDPSQEIHYIYDASLFKELLSLSSMFFCNEKEYEKAQQLAFDILKEKIIIRTEGEKGASLYLPYKGWMHFPAYPSKVVDTTGAGDSFRAGFYAALYRGYAMEDAVKYGNLVASKVVSSENTYYQGRWENLS